MRPDIRRRQRNHGGGIRGRRLRMWGQERGRGGGPEADPRSGYACESACEHGRMGRECGCMPRGAGCRSPRTRVEAPSGGLVLGLRHLRADCVLMSPVSPAEVAGGGRGGIISGGTATRTMMQRMMVHLRKDAVQRRVRGGTGSDVPGGWARRGAKARLVKRQAGQT